MASIVDVARLAGVSISTVSLSMNDPSRVSEATKKKILRAMKELHYVPASSRRTMPSADEKKNVVSVLAGDIAGPFYFEILRGISETLALSGMEMIMVAGDEMGRRHMRDLEASPYYCGAIALRSVDALEEALAALAARGFPVVLGNMESHIPGVGSVSVDNRHIGRVVAGHLLDMGHTRVAMMGNKAHCGQRLEGFSEGLKAAGLALQTDFLHEGVHNEKIGYDLMDAYLEKGLPLPGALFCANDEQALGVLEALKKHGKQAPRDLAVVGGDDIHISRYYTPAITTVQHPKFELGMLATNLLFRQMAGKPAEHIVLNGKLVIRESCGCKRRRSR